MEYFTLWIKNNSLMSHTIVSSVVIISYWIVRSQLIRLTRKSSWKIESKRKWLVSIRNWSNAILFFSIIFIWSNELQTFALSVVAVTAALIISGKELLLCALGGILRSFNNSFKVGDRIELGDIRGDVIDSNLMVTKILEIGPKNYSHQYTGRSIALPNSIFLTKQVVNESFMQEFVLHVFKVPFKRSENWKIAEACMTEAANIECSEFIEKAQKNLEQLSHGEGLEMPSAQPRITYQFTTSTDFDLIIRVPAPATKKGNLEQAILKRFMTNYPPMNNTPKADHK